MMSSVTNTVDLIFKVTDQATGPSKRLEGVMSGLKTAAGLAAAAIGGISIASAVKEAISLTADYEKTVLNTATKFRAFGIGDTFAESELATRSALRAIEDLADKLPGEAADYVTVFEQIIPKAVKSGMTNVKEIIDFTAQYTALLSGSGIDSAQAARDMVDILGGRAEVTTRSFTEVIKDLLPPTLATTEAFNKLGAEARRIELQKVFASPAVAEKMAKSADSLDSKLGEALSKMKRLIRESSAPMFQNALKLLDGLNAFISQNQEQIGNLVRLMGAGIEAAVKLAIPPLRFMLQHVEGIARAMAVVFGFWAGAGLASMLSGLGALIKQVQILYGAMRAFGVMTAITGMIQEAMGKGTAGMLVALGKAAVIGTTVTAAVLSINKALEGFESAEVKLPKVEELKFPEVTIPAPAEDKKKDKPAKTGPPKADVVIENARFDIKQNFAEGYDPDRIAAAFVDQLGAATMYRTQSAFSGQPGTGG
jgi:hypothetical protein